MIIDSQIAIAEYIEDYMETLFSHNSINLTRLKEMAFNNRWAMVPDGVIPLTAADSDFPVAREIQEGLIDYIEKGYFPYVPNMGYDSVRYSIANQLNKRKNEHVDPALLLPIDSAARGMYVIAQAILAEGDEAIIFDPVDYLFMKSVESVGALPVLFPARIGSNGRIDLSTLEKYITPKTKLIGLCNPHNPYGTLYSPDELRFILELAHKHDLYIMNDEIWSDIVFEPKKFCSILSLDPSLNERVLSVYGFSKSFGIAGLRAGCVYTADQDLFNRVVDVSSVMSTAGGISSLSQIAAQICMDKCYYWNEAFVRHLKDNRDYALKRINEMPGISCHKPDATFVLFPDISATNMSSENFVTFLLEEHKLALVPGTSRFFGPGAEGHVRICISTSRTILHEAMNRLDAGLKQVMNAGN